MEVTNTVDIFHGEGSALLVQAILSLKTEEECRAFLEDLMTGKEIQDCSQRILVAKLLREKLVYNQIARRQHRHHQPRQPLLCLRRGRLPDGAGQVGKQVRTCRQNSPPSRYPPPVNTGFRLFMRHA